VLIVLIALLFLQQVLGVARLLKGGRVKVRVTWGDRPIGSSPPWLEPAVDPDPPALEPPVDPKADVKRGWGFD
jgi:hypothetical protein